MILCYSFCAKTKHLRGYGEGVLASVGRLFVVCFSFFSAFL